MRSLLRSLLTFLVLFMSAQLLAQVRVTGAFLSDSIKIGEETAFYLTARYPSSLTILFPDSTDAYAPFEFQKKRYFPTQSEDGVSFDSAVYHVTTFEIDSFQVLQLPAYVLTESDCTVYMSNADSIELIHVVSEVPDSIAIADLPLKEHTAYQPVNFDINYVIVAIVVATVLIIALVVWIVFGKRIVRYFKAKKLRKNHQQFMRRYDDIVNDVSSTFSPSTTETALTAWKRYMEQLEARPYTKLTSAETIKLYNEETLGKNLREIDSAIYGHNQQVLPALQELKLIAGNKFEHKLQEVMHGK